jgi:hypothetical protein
MAGFPANTDNRRANCEVLVHFARKFSRLRIIPQWWSRQQRFRYYRRKFPKNLAGYSCKPIRISSRLDLMRHFGAYLALEDYFHVGSPSDLFIFLYLSISSDICVFIDEQIACRRE